MRQYLVVANQTLGGAELATKLTERAAAGPAEFHLVVPATRPPSGAVWTEGQARAVAEERLKTALEWFAQNGLTATGEVGDQQPLQAIGDALIARPFDEIILSTLPAGPSRWLRQDLPNRVRRVYGLPVTHVEARAVVARRTA